ncbi:hypothetical protein Vretifemale_18535, partial [Volvox reticuliferus]
MLISAEFIISRFRSSAETTSRTPEAPKSSTARELPPLQAPPRRAVTFARPHSILARLCGPNSQKPSSTPRPASACQNADPRVGTQSGGSRANAHITLARSRGAVKCGSSWE